ncbi:MAG: LuxR C-terminal-related transcriptional regulator [Solirubrobacterales bacterium]
MSQNPNSVEPSRVAAIVGTGIRRGMVAEIFRRHGWETDSYATVGELAEADCENLLVVIVELSLIDAAEGLKALGPAKSRPMTVVVCESIRAGEVRLALVTGVVGIISADSLATSLMPCVASARTGQVSVPRAQARQIEPAALSTREKQILGLVVMGCPNGEIAERLVVAESTVKSHLSSAFGKLGVRSRNEAVDLILDQERGLGMGILGLESEPIAS